MGLLQFFKIRFKALTPINAWLAFAQQVQVGSVDDGDFFHGLVVVDQVDEIIKKITAVMWSRCGFWVVLH